MSKLTDKINELASTEEKTVVVKRDDIENELRRIAEEKTVVDEKPVFDTTLDPEIEAILRETEGYVIDPEDAQEPDADVDTDPKPDKAPRRRRPRRQSVLSRKRRTSARPAARRRSLLSAPPL